MAAYLHPLARLWQRRPFLNSNASVCNKQLFAITAVVTVVLALSARLARAEDQEHLNSKSWLQAGRKQIQKAVETQDGELLPIEDHFDAVDSGFVYHDEALDAQPFTHSEKLVEEVRNEYSADALSVDDPYEYSNNIPGPQGDFLMDSKQYEQNHSQQQNEQAPTAPTPNDNLEYNLQNFQPDAPTSDSAASTGTSSSGNGKLWGILAGVGGVGAVAAGMGGGGGGGSSSGGGGSSSGGTSAPAQRSPVLNDVNGDTGYQFIGREAQSFTGQTITNLGDVNNDGYEDFGLSTTNYGAYLIYGDADGYPVADETPGEVELFNINGTTSIFRVTPDTNMKLAAAGDFDGDGIDDFMVTDANATNSGGLSGSVYVVFGKDQANFSNHLNEIDLESLRTANEATRFDGAAGDAVGGNVIATDFNGDGIGDIVIGSHQTDTVYVVFGEPGGTRGQTHILDSLTMMSSPQAIQITGDDDDRAFSHAMAGGDDINGDGIDDLIISAYQAGASGAPGEVFVFYGDSVVTGNLDVSDLDGTNGFKIEGSTTGESLGQKMHFVGDINADGYDDFLISTNRQDAVIEHGASYIIFGNSNLTNPIFDLSDLDGTNGFAVTGTAATSVLDDGGSGGDFNGDGIDDLAIAVSNDVDDTASVYVLYGKDEAFSASISISDIEGEGGLRLYSPSEHHFIHVDLSIDANADGFNDLLVGGFDGLNFVGESYVYYGYDSNDAINILGTNNSETITGTDESDVINAMRGNDIIHAGAGDDIIKAAGGNDLIDAGTGNNVVYGGSGDDRFYFGLNNGEASSTIIMDFYYNANAEADGIDLSAFTNVLRKYSGSDGIFDAAEFTAFANGTDNNAGVNNIREVDGDTVITITEQVGITDDTEVIVQGRSSLELDDFVL